MKLGRQLTAAKLNLAAGAAPVVLGAVRQADAFLVQHPLGSLLTPEERAAARELFRRALALDPRNPDAQQGMSALSR